MPDEMMARVTAELEWLRSVGGAARVSPESFDMDGLLARFGRAVDALDEVLKLADEAKEVRDYSGYETHGRLVGWNLRPAAIHEAISRALLGEEGSDGN